MVSKIYLNDILCFSKDYDMFKSIPYKVISDIIQYSSSNDIDIYFCIAL
ncbi:hypothetical protein MATR_15950 [Marivirga tractuosa]|uniref:Uncharacterized protein n=1 Tax=Marivirga tractuosa (strain ATCC 23168 / DSM 4126 / NBRC 15989 / NCIMB 1408 / VKM B-1430 / H-43) TaxID=643867 RepID=E4TSF9_MARTH|nr:hypothetical protein Ftrac_0777 [Marivirga tractuosa DSM 4126]BDD14770.1 hypothetical protein MATR_15950 [Marivirga tractuosa]